MTKSEVKAANRFSFWGINHQGAKKIGECFIAPARKTAVDCMAANERIERKTAWYQVSACSAQGSRLKHQASRLKYQGSSIKGQASLYICTTQQPLAMLYRKSLRRNELQTHVSAYTTTF